MALHCAWKTWRGSSWAPLLRRGCAVERRDHDAHRQQPGANALETANSVRATMEDLAERFLPGLEHVTPYDTTLFIDASVETVLKTFIEAFLIVIVILFIFPQNWRFTVIAMSVVPVSVIGTFAGFYLFDFSINLLTLFALVLSIGIVVDDAILVVENVERVLSEEDDISVRDATIRAMKEVGGPVIATSIMAAVFVLVAFMGGYGPDLPAVRDYRGDLGGVVGADGTDLHPGAVRDLHQAQPAQDPSVRFQASHYHAAAPVRSFLRRLHGALHVVREEAGALLGAGTGADRGGRGGLLLAVCQYALHAGARNGPGDRAGQRVAAGRCLAGSYPELHG